VDFWQRFHQPRLVPKFKYFITLSQKGGIDENRHVLRCFRHLRPGQKMLDIGVGIGGGARQAARVSPNFILKSY
jgi:cyclopropane fatty-acyl-phospholipid synthase-like methyltransferase